MYFFKLSNKYLWLMVFSIALQSCASVVVEKPLKITRENIEQTSYTALPKELEEISGLLIDSTSFWGFNDSGGKPELYKFNPKTPNKIEKTLKLTGATNVDWESIAHSDSLVFVADFGNNNGNRKDLKIYYFPKKALSQEGEQISTAVEEIEFFFPEQTNYDKQSHNHDFDVESMFYLDGKIHLFTKEWKSQRTHHYTLDLVTGKQPAWLVESLDTGFLVTGADAKKIEGKVVTALVGYTKAGGVFAIRGEAEDEAEKILTKGHTTKIKLGISPRLGQVEGVSIVSKNKLCYSAEKLNYMGFKHEQNITCLKFNE